MQLGVGRSKKGVNNETNVPPGRLGHPPPKKQEKACRWRGEGQQKGERGQVNPYSITGPRRRFLKPRSEVNNALEICNESGEKSYHNAVGAALPGEEKASVKDISISFIK